MTETETTLTQADLSQFTGGLERYQTWANKNVISTDGIEYLARTAGAFWLIDCISSYFGTRLMRNAIEQDDRLNWLQFWRLEVHDDHSATVTSRADYGVEPFVTQQIEFTDFPLDGVDIWAGFDGTRWTLYLPSEHQTMGNVQFKRVRAMSRRVKSLVVLSPLTFEKPSDHRFEAAHLSLRSRWRAKVVRLRFSLTDSLILVSILSMEGGTMFQRLLQSAWKPASQPVQINSQATATRRKEVSNE